MTECKSVEYNLPTVSASDWGAADSFPYAVRRLQACCEARFGDGPISITLPPKIYDRVASYYFAPLRNYDPEGTDKSSWYMVFNGIKMLRGDDGDCIDNQCG